MDQTIRDDQFNIVQIFIEEIERKEKFQNVANMFKNIVLANRQINAVFICALQYAKKTEVN